MEARKRNALPAFFQWVFRIYCFASSVPPLRKEHSETTEREGGGVLQYLNALHYNDLKKAQMKD